MNKPLILAVEDDTAVRNLITTTLETQDYRFHTAANGAQAILEAASQKPDIMLLDLGLPDMDGVEVIKKIRSWSNLPIIVISARSEDRDKIEALDAGADDYLTKPFSVEELLDYVSGCVYLKGQELHMTSTEYKLLILLSKNVGKVLTHTYITKEIWGSAWDNDVASLRVFMATLRKKIEENPSQPKYIQTHVGIGYRMLRVAQ